MMYYDKIVINDDPDDIGEGVIENGTAPSNTTSATTTLATITSDMTTVAVVQLLEERLGKLKVPELKDELNNRGEGNGHK